jgi:hypothetical protein
MESTWETRDLPVLEEAVRYFDENPMQPGPTVGDIAERIGMDPTEVLRAVRALDETYLELRIYAAGGRAAPHRVLRVYEEARRVVGQWPSPEAVADRVVRELLDAAEREPDEAKRTRLRAAADALGGFGRDLLINVIANVATKPIGF